MPGVDRDPFGHDDDREDGDDLPRRHGPRRAACLTGRSAGRRRRRADRDRQVGPRPRPRRAPRRRGRQRRRHAALPRHGHRHGQAAAGASAAASPHHQLDVLDVTEEASVAAYQVSVARRHRRDPRPRAPRGARRRLGPLRARGPRPARDPADRPGGPGAGSRRSWPSTASSALRARLRDLDPAAAAAIEPNNGRRIVRALEVVELTGRPFSRDHADRGSTCSRRWCSGSTARPAGPRRADRPRRAPDVGATVSSTRPRSLLAQGLREGRTASKALGYRQALAQLDGTMTAEEAQDDTATATRRYARRQESWFRAGPAGRLARRTTRRPGGPGARRGRGGWEDARMTTVPLHQGPRHAERLRAGARPRRHARPLTTDAGAPARRPPRRARRRRRDPRRADRARRGGRGARAGRRGRVVHGLPQRRRLAGRDVRQRVTRVFAAYLRREGLRRRRTSSASPPAAGPRR